VKKWRKLIIPILFCLFNLCLVLYPSEVITAAREGLLLWFNNVLPSLLPFAAGINILMGLGFVRLAGGVLAPVTGMLFKVSGAGGFALISGMASGYPMGAKTVAQLRLENQLTREEAQRLIGFCNNAGPLFVVGVAGTGLFGSAETGYILWISHILSALALGFALRFTGEGKKIKYPVKNAIDDYRRFRRDNDCSLGFVLSGGIKNAMETMVFVGGTILFFCVAARLVTMAVGENGLLAGLLEMTNGVKILARSKTSVNIALAAAVISFGGFSVHAQSFHFLSKIHIKAGLYLLCKFVHAVLAGVICLIILTIQP
jgi:sporulation integral membrane protein YlbJ